MAQAHENHAERASLRAKEHHAGRRERARATDETAELVFTVDTKTGGVLKVSKIDSHGKRAEVSNEEFITLAGADNVHEIETTLDDAFEAGITSVIEPESGDETNSISDEEMELRHDLLTGIVGRGIRRRLVRRLLQRVILSKALSH